MCVTNKYMKNPNEPLEYPPHYPPTDCWKKFFIGVRWLGPDISFFKDLKRQQDARTAESMNAWESSTRKEMASVFGQSFAKHCGWPKPYFLPNDRMMVIVNGPSYGSIFPGDVDDLDIEEAFEEIEENLHQRFPDSFWSLSLQKTLGEVVDDIIMKRGTVTNG